MKRIKIYLQTPITTTHLHNNLGLISIKREFSSELIKDLTKIINNFAKLKNRRTLIY